MSLWWMVPHFPKKQAGDTLFKKPVARRKSPACYFFLTADTIDLSSADTAICQALFI
jgi:hypothetical protein